MKLLVCVKVVEGDGPEPICETRIATSERDACLKLLELWDDNPWEEDWNPFSLAKTISGDGRFFYVEEHEAQVVPMSPFEKCVVPGSLECNGVNLAALARVVAARGEPAPALTEIMADPERFQRMIRDHGN